MNIEKLETLEDLKICLAEHEEGIKTVEDLKISLADHQQGIDSLDGRCKELQAAVKSGIMLNYQDDKARTHKQFGTLLKGIAKKSYGNKLSAEEVDMLERAPRPEKDVTFKAAMATDLTSDATTGSYSAPVELMNEIQYVVEEASELKPLVRDVPMGSLTKTIPVEADDIDFTYISSQSGDASEANPSFTVETLQSYTYASFVGVSEEFMEDQAVGIGDYFTRLVGMAYARKFDSEFLVGTGSPVTGLMSDTGVQSVSMGAGASTFSDITVEDFYNMEAELAGTNGALLNAGWTMSQYTWNLIKRMADANGRPLIVDSFQGIPSKSIIGYPVHLSSQMPGSSSDAGSTAFVGFGNYRRFVYGNRVGLEIKYFPDTHYMVGQCEAFFRFRFRAAFVITLPSTFAVLSTAA